LKKEIRSLQGDNIAQEVIEPKFPDANERIVRIFRRKINRKIILEYFSSRNKGD